MLIPILFSLIWLCAGAWLALTAPWRGLLPDAVQLSLYYAGFAITVLLIIWNLIVAIRLVGRTGRTLTALPLTIVQFFLFTLALLQIACHGGADHYRWDEFPRASDCSAWPRRTVCVRVTCLT